MEAEREIVELKKMQFMLDKIGAEYDGFITGVSVNGIFVELVDMFVEGMVHVSTLPRDFYRYLEKQHALVGEHHRQVFRIGDKVRVVVANVSPEKRQIDFALLQTANSRNAAIASAKNDEYTHIPIKGKRPEKVKKQVGKRKAPRSGGRRWER
jgi:ribonuclease R